MPASGNTAKFRRRFRAHRAAIFSASVMVLFGGSQSAALASPGCSSLNGTTNGVSFTGSFVGTGFSKGDTIIGQATGLSKIGLTDVTTNTVLVVESGSFTYQVPANTPDELGVPNTIVAGASISWSCTAAPSNSTSNTDSLNLRSLEIAGTQTVATISGQVITGAVEDAIDNAFTNGTAPIVFGPNGLFLSFAGEPQRDPATQDALDALAYAGGGNMTYKAPRSPSFDPGWSAWADLRGTGFDQNSASTHEEQVNVTEGIGKKLSPDLLVGLFTGYEDFSFTMESIAGKLTGDGGTIGSYAAWRYAEHWRLDGMFGWTDMFYSGAAGTASGSFTGSRWLGSGGFTGNYGLGKFVLEPSARIYTLWERDSAFTDALGTAQGVNKFSASRVSLGDKISYPWQASPTWLVAPYVGLYSDYRFSTSGALPVAVPFVGIQNGWSERVTAGATFSTARAGPSLSLGGELGGLGAGYDLWSVNARANWPF